MKSRYIFYFSGLSVFSLILGTIFRSWVFFILAIGSISFLSISLRGLPPKNIDLEIKRKSESIDIYEGDEAWIETEIENKGDSLKFLEAMDEIPDKIEVLENSNHQVFEIDKNERLTMRYKVKCPLRGELDIGPLNLRYRDIFGIFFEEIECDSSIKIHVLPEIEKMKGIKIRPSYTRNWLGNIKSRTIGIGTEFFSLREYVPGDEMRKINWKATARHLNPITNEYEGERCGDVILVVDGYKGSNIGTLRKNTTRASIKAAASLASTILEDRNRVGLIMLGNYLNWVYPGSGREQFYKIIDSLSKVEQGGVWKAQDAKWIIKRFFPRKSLIVFITPLIESKIKETVIDMCMEEFDVMVISPNPLQIEKEITEDYDPIAERILKMERENIIDTIWKYAIVVDWDINEPLAAALKEVERYSRRR